MPRFSSAFPAWSAAALTGALVLATAAPAHAATGEVIVYKTELEALDTYQNPPNGECYTLAGTAHVLLNRTDAEVTIHSNPNCLFPGVPVQPDHGWHAPSSGISGVFSFSIG